MSPTDGAPATMRARMQAERKPFKLWFDGPLVRETAARILAVEPDFDSDAFVRKATRGLGGLEMLDRVGNIAEALHAALPRPTARALRALVASMPPPIGTTEGVTEHGYKLWPYGEFIARHGLDDIDASFAAMVELTRRFSAEFAVRPFLAAYPDEMLARLESLVAHEDPHVRRWVSEGTRTRLPWGKRVPALEERAERRLALLAKLRHDGDRYVQRSVANHLQDILKDDRELAFPVLAAWSCEGREETTWIARHAARGLLKAGCPETLALFGHAARGVEVVHFSVKPKRIVVGGAIELLARITHTGRRPARVRLDYELESPGAREKPLRKVFRFADVELAPGETVERRTNHAFVHRTIRTIRPGVHRLTLRANGVEGGVVEVRVVD